MKKKTLAEAFKAHKDSISVMDVNASIGDDDVKYWNAVIRTSIELGELIPADKAPPDGG